MIIPPDPSSPTTSFLWTVLILWWVHWMAFVIMDKVKELLK